MLNEGRNGTYKLNLSPACKLSAGRDTAYKLTMALLKDGNMAVRIAACDALLRLVDDVSFFPDSFVAYLPEAMAGIFGLLDQAREVDTKLRVLNAVSIVMQGMGERVAPVVGGVLQAVPRLWEAAKQEQLLMGAVLVTITRLVEAMGDQVVTVIDFITGVIAFSTDVDAEYQLYTVEDGLELWWATARRLEAPHPPLLALFTNLVRVIQRDFDFLQLCMHVAESSLLCAPADRVRTQGEGLGRL